MVILKEHCSSSFMRKRFRRSDSANFLDFVILRTEDLKYQTPLDRSKPTFEIN